MTALRDWIAHRVPPAPEPLASWIDGVGDAGDGSVAERLLDAGLAELDAARAAPGRVRRSAFHLLAADALLTYACEAALDTEDPDATLRGILQKAANPVR